MTSSYERDVRATTQRALDAARATWGAHWQPTRVAIAPGRIEILGNHTDYNGGPVLAAAVDRATVVLSDDSGMLELLFENFPDIEPLTIDSDHVDDLRSEYGLSLIHI